MVKTKTGYRRTDIFGPFGLRVLLFYLFLRLFIYFEDRKMEDVYFFFFFYQKKNTNILTQWRRQKILKGKGIGSQWKAEPIFFFLTTGSCWWRNFGGSTLDSQWWRTQIFFFSYRLLICFDLWNYGSSNSQIAVWKIHVKTRRYYWSLLN